MDEGHEAASTVRLASRVVVVVGLGVVGIAVAVYFGAQLLVRHKGTLSPAQLLTADNAARTSIIQLIGGIGLVGGLIFTVRTYGLTRHTQRTDLFTKAVDQIGNEDSETVRVGGIYALWLLAYDAREFWLPGEELLSAFIRKWATTPVGSQALPPGGVQAALTVLGRRPRRDAGYRGTPLNLRGVYIKKADLTTANLERVHLENAHLELTTLVDARLVRARLTDSHLDHADLSSADLTNATLIGASLKDAEMFKTVLIGANITGCDFTGAKNLTADQLRLAKGAPAALP